jgi:hypothetical protein
MKSEVRIHSMGRAIERARVDRRRASGNTSESNEIVDAIWLGRRNAYEGIGRFSHRFDSFGRNWVRRRTRMTARSGRDLSDQFAGTGHDLATTKYERSLGAVHHDTGHGVAGQHHKICDVTD